MSMHVCGCARKYVCVGQQITLTIVPKNIVHILCNSVFHCLELISLAQLADQPVPGILLSPHPQLLDPKCTPPYLALLYWFWGSNSGP